MHNRKSDDAAGQTAFWLGGCVVQAEGSAKLGGLDDGFWKLARWMLYLLRAAECQAMVGRTAY